MWWWWIAFWADDDEQYKEEQPREGLFLAGAMNCSEEFSHPPRSLSLLSLVSIPLKLSLFLPIVYLNLPELLSSPLCPVGGWSYL